MAAPVAAGWAGLAVEVGEEVRDAHAALVEGARQPGPQHRLAGQPVIWGREIYKIQDTRKLYYLKRTINTWIMLSLAKKSVTAMKPRPNAPSEAPMVPNIDIDTMGIVVVVVVVIVVVVVVIIMSSLSLSSPQGEPVIWEGNIHRHDGYRRRRRRCRRHHHRRRRRRHHHHHVIVIIIISTG